MEVYEVQGWMGDQEWTEGLYANRADAEKRAGELWETRTSEHAPEWTAGFCKFAVEAREVIPSSTPREPFHVSEVTADTLTVTRGPGPVAHGSS